MREEIFQARRSDWGEKCIEGDKKKCVEDSNSVGAKAERVLNSRRVGLTYLFILFSHVRDLMPEC